MTVKKTPKNIETRPFIEAPKEETLATDSQPKYRIRNKSAHYVNYDIPKFGSCYIAPSSISRSEFSASDLAGKQITIAIRSGEIEIVKA